MNTQHQSRPVITPAMREQAAKQPNTWLYVVDPIFTDSHAEVPPWGFIGGYRVDEGGEITDDFSPNPNYRPSPVTLRLPAPTNDAERALQLTTTGYAQGGVLLSALLEAELILFAQPQGDGLVTMDHASGRRQLQVFTSEVYLPSNWTTWQRLTGRALAERRPDRVDLQINPTSSVKARVPGEDLLKAAGVTVAATEPAADRTPAPSPAAPSPAAPTPAGTGHTPPADATQPVGSATLAEGAEPSGSENHRSPSPGSPGEEQTPENTPDPAASDFGDRFLGALLAGAVGDALGAAVEFYPVDQIRSRYGDDGVTDYDRTGEATGAFTDDTQLALFTLEGLIRGHIAVRTRSAESPLPAVQLAYQRWLHTQGYGWQRAAGPFLEAHPDPDGWLVRENGLFAVRSPGSAGISALRDFAAHSCPGTFDHALNDSDSCGGVVRAAAVALWSDDPREVFELGCATAALTYSHPDGYLPAGVMAVLVHRLLHGESLVDAVGLGRELLANYAGHRRTDEALRAAVTLAERGTPSPERLKDAIGSGWNGPEALAIAVCAVLATDDLRAAVTLSVNHSGDSDSTGAACGALAGAHYGMSAIPGVWLRDLNQRDTVENLGRDALLEFGAAPPDDVAWQLRYPAGAEIPGLRFTTTPPKADAPERSHDGTPDSGKTVTASAGPAGPEVAADPAPEASPDQEVVPAVPRREALPARRVRGCLLGGAVGDALGYAIEFDSLEAIRHKYGEHGLDDYVDAHRPGGSISDDTQMTLFTLEGLIRASIRRRRYGETEPATQVQYAYQRWLHTQGFDWRDARGPVPGGGPDGWLIAERGLFVRRAPGATCIQALHGFASGRKAGSFGHRLNDSKGCGGVMRAAPAGLWADDSAEVFRVGALTGVLTHGHPSGFLPAGALAVIVQQLLAGGSLPEAVTRALDELSGWDENLETTACIRRAMQLAADGDPSAEKIQQQLGGGWVGEEALAIAVYAALTHPSSFQDAIVLAANHSGDSDSTAAICGNIMGAGLGDDAIPSKWLEQLELRTVIEQLVTDAVHEFGPNPPEEDEWLRRYPVTRATPGPSPLDDGSVEDPDGAGDPSSGTPDDDTSAVPEPRDTATAEIVPDEQASLRAEASHDANGGDRDLAVASSIWAGAMVNHETNATELADLTSENGTASGETADTSEAPDSAEAPDTGNTADDVVDGTAPDRSPSDEAADEPAVASEPLPDPDSALSEEELRLLATWRRFRDGSEDPSKGIHKLLVEAFGSDRADELAGVDAAEPPALPSEAPLELDLPERLAGCVLGGAAGDSLGAPWTLSGLSSIEQHYPDVIGKLGEAFGRRGAATAITQQAAYVLDGLVRAEVRGRSRGIRAHRPGMVRVSLQLWLSGQGGGYTPVDVTDDDGPGGEALGAQRFPDEASVTAIAQRRDRSVPPRLDAPPNNASDAAAVARGAVVGLFAQDVESALSLGAETAVVTHGSPDGYLPAAALAGLTRSLADGATVAGALEAVLPEMDDLEGSEATVRGLRAAVELVRAGPVAPRGLETLGADRSGPTSLAVAVAAALAHPDSFPDAVSLAATHSGNSAATAAICGGLLGTSRGAPAIPVEWLDELELREVLESLLADHGRLDEVHADHALPGWAGRYAT